MTEEEENHNQSEQKQMHEVYRHQSDMTYHIAKEEYNLLQMLKPKIFKDGNQWCVLYGENLQDGIAGFGSTPYKAILAFNSAFNEPIKEKEIK